MENHKFNVHGIEGCSVTANMDNMKKARAEDKRGFATFDLLTKEGKQVKIKDSEGTVCPVQVLIWNKNKKSKGSDKVEGEVF